MIQRFKWRMRYSVAVMLILAWIISYVDRMAMSVAIPYIAKDFGLSPVGMGVVLSSFFAGYAICQIPGGFLADRFGYRKPMVWTLIAWSIFTFLTGLATSLTVLIIIRFLFGIAEGSFTPAAWKAVSTWFPQRERGTVTGMVFSSQVLGPALAPLLGAAIIAVWGWHALFFALFIPGLIIAFTMWLYFKDPVENKWVTAEELAEIQEPEPPLMKGGASQATFFDIIKTTVIFQCFCIAFFANITYWGFVTWLPTYLIQARGFAIGKMGILASLPFFAGAVGYSFGGWLSDKYFRYNRKIPIILFRLIGCVMLYLTYNAESHELLTIYLTLTGFFMSAGGGCYWALPLGILPKAITGRAMGFINTGAMVAGVIAPSMIGFLVQTAGGSFNTTFILLIGAYLISALITVTVKQTKPEEPPVVST